MPRFLSTHRRQNLRALPMELDRLPVELLVPPRGGRPRIVGLHPADLELPPGRRVFEGLDRPNDRRVEIYLVVSFEGKTISVAGRRIEVLNRIRQTTGMPNDRDTPVPQANQLTEATRLEPRRHQEHVRAGVDLLRERRVE